MSPKKRQLILVGVMVAMLAVVTVWCGVNMLSQRDRAQRAADALSEANRIAQRIAVLRERGDQVASAGGDTESQEQELAQRISTAAQQARITGAWQQGIDHKRARRVGDTPYMRKPAVVFTQGLTMDQLVALLHHLTYDSPLTVSELNLKTPRGSDPGDRWDADVTLSYLIYQPQEAARPNP